MSAVEEQKQQQDQQGGEKVVEAPKPEAPAAEAGAAGAAGGAAAFTAEGAIPAAGDAASKVAATPTPSEQAYGTDEVTPADRTVLLQTARTRLAGGLSPLLLAISNRREQVHKAVTSHPHFVGTLAKLAFGSLVPGVSKNKGGGSGELSPASGKLVSSAANRSGHMKSVVDRAGETPMKNFNDNYPNLAASETDDELVDMLHVHLGDSTEAMMGGLEDKSNEELASICAAFDPASNTTSIYLAALEHELTLATAGHVEKQPEEQELEVPPTKELAFVGDPGEGAEKEQKLAVVEQGGKDGKEKDPKIVNMVPDEMKEMAISQQGHEPGTLHDDKLHHRT